MLLRLPLLVLSVGLVSACGEAEPGTQAPTTSDGAPSATDVMGPATTSVSLPPPYNAADLENGRRRFALCRSCHTLPAGAADGVGPNLHGIVGRAAVSGGFAYSDALKASGLTWTPETLDQWIESPRDLVPNNKMTFVGLKDAEDRRDLIAYLMVETAE